MYLNELSRKLHCAAYFTRKLREMLDKNYKISSGERLTHLDFLFCFCLSCSAGDQTQDYIVPTKYYITQL